MAFPQVGVEAAIVGLNKFNSGLAKMQGGVDKFSGAVDKAASPVKRLGGGLIDLGTKAAKVGAVGLISVGVAATGVATASVKAAIDFESAWAGVVKTTDGLEDEFGNLTETGERLQRGFRDLSKTVPITVEDLLEIGELGGQLGIAEGALVDFAETIAAVGVATNLTTEEAAVGFAQLANIMGTPQSQIGNMASTVVALGNNFATTERDVFNFAQRIAGAGQIAGLTEAQVFGIGAAMSSVGVQAEAGGTAVQKVLLSMNEAVTTSSGMLGDFASVAGMSADEFAEAWEADAGAAFNQFVVGLGDAGDDALGILDNLELKDQRLIRSFLSLAGAGDLLERAMDEANVAFDENVALQEEASKRYATTESKIAILKNTIKDVAITIGLALLPAFNAVLDIATRAAAWLGDKLARALNNVLIPAIEDAIDILEDLYKVFKSDILPLISRRVQKAIDGLKIALYRLGQAFGYAFAGDVAGVMETVWSAMYEGLGLSDELSIKISDTAGAIVEWFSIAIPSAILTFSQVWQTNITPIVDSLATIIFDRLIPAFSALWSWLSEIIPQALDALSPMVDVLQQVFMTLAGQIAGPLVLAFMLLRGDFDEVLIPVLQFLADFIENTVIPAVASLANFINQHSDAIVGAIQGIGVALTAAKIAGIIAGIVAAIGSLISPVGLLIAGIALLGAAWADNWLGIRDIVGAVVEWLMVNVPLAFAAISEFFNTVLLPAFQQVGEFIATELVPAIESIARSIINFVTPIIEDFSQFLIEEFGKMIAWTQENWPLIQETIKTVLTAIATAVGAVLLAISEFWSAHGDKIVEYIMTSYETMKIMISQALEAVRGIILAIMQIINGDWEGAWESIKGVLENVWEIIVAAVKLKLAELTDVIIPIALDAIKALFELSMDAVAVLWENKWEILSTIGQFAMDAIESLIEAAFGTIKEIVFKGMEAAKNLLSDALDSMVQAVVNIGPLMKSAGEAIINMLKEGLSSALEGVKDWFGNQLNQLTDMLPGSEPKDRSSPLYGLSKSGEAIINNLMDGVAMAMPGAIDKMKVASTAIGEALTANIPSFDDIIGRIGTLAGLGGIAKDIYERLEVDPLAERTKDARSTLEAMLDAESDLIKEREKMIAISEDESKSAEERVDATKSAAKLYKEIRKVRSDIAQQQEKVGEMSAELRRRRELVSEFEAEKERTSFLKQQMAVIEMIQREGLDADKILGGLKFGAEANPEEIMIAMTRAMAEMNDELEDRVENTDDLIARLEEEKRLAEERARLQAQKDILSAEKERQSFLRSQLGLVKELESWGISPGDIFGDFEISPTADVLEFTRIAAEATRLITEQMMRDMRKAPNPFEALLESAPYYLQDAAQELYDEFDTVSSRIAEINERLRAGDYENIYEQIALQQELSDLEQDRLDLLAERERIAAPLAGIAGEQETQDFLQEQLDLLALIQEHGLDANEILGELQLGEDARGIDILNARERIMAAITEQMRAQLANQDEIVARMEEQQALAEAQAELEAARAQQQFLQDQMELLDLIQEHGLDADEILQGFEVGAGASMLEFTQAMTRAIQAMIAQTEAELGIASPSKVFEQIGAFTGEGFAIGFTNSMNAAMGGALDIMAQSSIPSISSPSTFSQPSTTTSTEINIVLTGNTFGSPAAMRSQAAILKQELAPLLRGEY